MGGNKCNVPVCHHDQCGDGICARPSMCQCPDGSFKKSCNDEDPAHEVWDHQFYFRFGVNWSSVKFGLLKFF